MRNEFLLRAFRGGHPTWSGLETACSGQASPAFDATASRKSMFERSRILLEQYYGALLNKGMSLRAKHLIHELRARLRTLQWLHSRLVDLDKQVEGEARASIPPSEAQPDVMKCVFSDGGRPHNDDFREGKVAFSSADELRALLEAFYYCAFRVRDILRDRRAVLQGLGSFEAVGIRNVRNHLIEHSDGPSGIIVSSFATGGPVGPQLKPIRWSSDPIGTNDDGLHANAAELDMALVGVLERAIAVLAA